MNHSRRTFRGRGGPNDRRLPKHNARRRKPHPINDENDETIQSPSKYADPHPRTRLTSLDDVQETEEHFKSSHHDKLVKDEESSEPMQEGDRHEDPCLQEVRHLRRRIRNVLESIQTSTALVDPLVYQEICLNAVANCVKEWRSIARRYGPSSSSEQTTFLSTTTTTTTSSTTTSSSSSTLPTELHQETALHVFQLVQLSVQSGPLSGAKPGYFKRCGGHVAAMVAKYLEDVVPKLEQQQQPNVNDDYLGFSSQQVNIMNKWLARAKKAIDNDKLPSTFVLKQQQRHTQNKIRKKK
jgi:hypothetical protein